ncbi:MAG TPA: RluA family pseudouridine synthase [Vicinamibacterales bacterium]|jgi:23S rRNA pseudouridine1911/1915/1917 synthase
MRRLTCTATDGEAGTRLDDLIGHWLPAAVGHSLSKSAVRRLIMAGAVCVDARVARRPGLRLTRGMRLDVQVDVERLRPQAAARSGPLAPVIHVLYRDEWLVSVAKPAGLQTHAAADTRLDDLVSATRRLLNVPYLGVHHRLDRDTSGVVLFSLDPAANAGLAAAFADRAVDKVYHALTTPGARVPGRPWRVEGLLALSGSGLRARMTRVAAGGKRAETSFVVRQRLPRACVVEARPLTGRKHQIRAHLAECGLPILGDRRYGGPTAVGGARVVRAMLHAVRLTLPHPVSGRSLRIECPYPEDFASLLRQLGGRLDTTKPSR